MKTNPLIGTTILDLTPSPGNPRNSEGAFYTRKDGSIIFLFSHYNSDSASDEANADLAFITSLDQGNSFSTPEVLFTAEEHQATNIMSVSILPLENDDMALFYLVRRGWHDTRLHMRRFCDDGRLLTDRSAWSTEICCVAFPSYHVTNNDRVIRLKSGRLLFPTGCHDLTHNPDDSACHTNVNSIVCFFYSDDDGRTWKQTTQNLAENSAVNPSGLQEPGVVELDSDVVWCYARTDLGRQYQSFSLDGGMHWTQPEASSFTGPCSPLCIKKTQNGKLFAVWNPIPMYQTRPHNEFGWGRTPLVYSFSSNHGKTWDKPIMIEDDPEAGFCYTAIHFIKDGILLAYCAGRNPLICLANLRIRKIDLMDSEKERKSLL